MPLKMISVDDVIIKIIKNTKQLFNTNNVMFRANCEREETKR